MTDKLERSVQAFSDELDVFPGFKCTVFEIGALLDDPNWTWGYEHGVYCFMDGDELAYVGRALGSTLGERIWNQLHSTSDPKWAAVVENRQNRVAVFSADARWSFVASALEAFLTQDPRPPFNLKRQ